MAVRLTAEADDPRAGMTLAELEEFTMQARAAGYNSGDTLTATVSMRGRVKTIGVVPTKRPPADAGAER